MWAKSNIRSLFNAAAPRYDRLNRIVSFGMDRGWRRRLAELSCPRSGGELLDLCAGTGELCVEFCRLSRKVKVTAVDFSPGMLACAREKMVRRGFDGRVRLVQADVLALPFSDGSFGTVSMGFGLRNLLDYRRGLREVMRALIPGGTLAIMEAAAPAASLFGRMYRFYLRFILPAVGRMFGDGEGSYAYFSSSVRSFVAPSEIAVWLRDEGFVDIRQVSLSAGITTLIFCEKPRG